MSKRWELLVKKYGSEEKARAEMKRRADLSRRNKGGKGGFASLKRDKLIEISKKGGLGGKKENDSQT